MAEYVTYIAKLCESRARRSLLDYLMNADGDWQTAGDIVGETDLDRPTVEEEIEFLVLAGIADSSDAHHRFTQYRPARSTEPRRALQLANEALADAARAPSEHPGTPLTFLYESTARRELVDLFLEAGVGWEDGDDPLSKLEITNRASADWPLVRDEMEILYAYDLVAESNEFGYPRYVPQVESRTFERLLALNETLADAVRDTVDERDEQLEL